ncbi:MAG TPA: LON peptidase substrate-binding domain-containing protein, partial [Thiobacillus sp.]|nr:LON peptidase substrate-binding domain-containing protein [Thiobacillus sp.]
MSAALEQFRLPLFPLNAVVFPGGRLPLRIFEQRYLDMVKQAIADNTPFGICAIREGAETGAPAAPYTVGTRVRVTDWDMPQAGILHIDTQAEERFVIRSTHTEPGGLLIGSVE